uniref:Uncharacterized protein n=1 Tax=Meloidogyne enterolobii TaxID=390850 RepID=A0A6V7VY40_MELEN|nr:unnamed protein product [Meloidogyne enterolobii]
MEIFGDKKRMDRKGKHVVYYLNWLMIRGNWQSFSLKLVLKHNN